MWNWRVDVILKDFFFSLNILFSFLRIFKCQLTTILVSLSQSFSSISILTLSQVVGYI